MLTVGKLLVLNVFDTALYCRQFQLEECHYNLFCEAFLRN